MVFQTIKDQRYYATQLYKSFSAANVKFDFGKLGKYPSGVKAGYVARRNLDAVNAFGKLNETNSQRITAGLINGGIKTPHFHLGKEIVLVDRTQFKNILGEVARDVFEQRALQMDDCLEVIAPLVESEG